MNADAQALIQQVRTHISAQDYRLAEALVRDIVVADKNWTQQEKDEVLCLQEFLSNLSSPLIY